MKYIRTENRGFVLFQEYVTHADMASWLHCSDTYPDKGDRVLSAGFVSIGPAGAICYGESVSLGIKSDPGDTERLERIL